MSCVMMDTTIVRSSRDYLSSTNVYILSPQTTDFLALQLAKEHISNTFKQYAHLNFIWWDSNKLIKEKDIVKIVMEVSVFLNLKHNVEQEQKLCSRYDGHS